MVGLNQIKEILRLQVQNYFLMKYLCQKNLKLLLIKSNKNKYFQKLITYGLKPQIDFLIIKNLLH